MRTKLTMTLVAVVLMSVCEPFSAALATSEAHESRNFVIDTFDVNLTESIHVEGYPDQEAVTKILCDKTVAALAKQNRLAAEGDDAAYSVSIQVDYERHFAGDASPVKSKSVASPRVNYTVIISDHGMEKAKIRKTNLLISKGIGGNLRTAFTLGLGRTTKDELDDMETLAKALAREIIGSGVKQ